MTFEGEWARCAPWLQAALDRAGEGFGLDYVLAEVMAHRATFWPFRDAALVTELVQTDGAREANFWLAGGSLRCLLNMRPHIETRLVADGYTAITIIGRSGWARALRAFGYRPCGEELRKVLA
jgi:hypothetical protein